MNHAQNTKAAIVVKPQSIGTTAVSGYVDSLNWDHVQIDYIGDTAAAADVITTLKLIHGDSTSAFSDVTGGAPSVIPAPNTNTGDVIRFNVNKKGGTIKRYVGISIVGDATARLTAVVANLSRGRVTPTSDSEAGCSEIVYV